ncbi:Alpha/beta hydrolase fold [Parasponia andersonii]|uniref:Alpha/beta hydrolase fold n=1 Tax=Parasponia andersonii TaxID=3476 RepID=A0A2P5D410_PARAD|nr:Alpha/beta hydrolase fold [Parasponia andersonii]
MAGKHDDAFAAGDYQPDHAVVKWYSVTDFRLRYHRFTVPLDYSSDLSAASASPKNKISIFARDVVAVRGTGLSTPLTYSSLLQFQSAQDLADYVKHFRADSIVHDAEFIRVRLVPDAGTWTALGQSYGGFCAVTYLSFAQEGLKQVLLTGGIPPIRNASTADAVSRACFEQFILQNEKYYKRYPEDVEIVQEVVNYLSESEGGGVDLPSGGMLTLQACNLSVFHFWDAMLVLSVCTTCRLETVWNPVIVPGAPKRISYNFLVTVRNIIASSLIVNQSVNIISHQPFSSLLLQFEKLISFKANPLSALLSESIFCQGASSQWSAQRIRGEYESEFDAIRALYFSLERLAYYKLRIFK